MTIEKIRSIGSCFFRIVEAFFCEILDEAQRDPDSTLSGPSGRLSLRPLLSGLSLPPPLADVYAAVC